MLEQTQGWRLLQASWPHVSQQVSNCPPALSSTGTNITCISSFCKGCLQDKCEQLERQLQHTQRPFSSSLQKWLLKVPTPSPQFLPRVDMLHFLKTSHLGSSSLLWALTSQSSGLLPPAPDAVGFSVLHLLPPPALLVWASGSVGQLFASPFLWDLCGSRADKHRSPRVCPLHT